MTQDFISFALALQFIYFSVMCEISITHFLPSAKGWAVGLIPSMGTVPILWALEKAAAVSGMASHVEFHDCSIQPGANSCSWHCLLILEIPACTTGLEMGLESLDYSICFGNNAWNFSSRWVQSASFSLLEVWASKGCNPSFSA